MSSAATRPPSRTSRTACGPGRLCRVVVTTCDEARQPLTPVPPLLLAAGSRTPAQARRHAAASSLGASGLGLTEDEWPF